MITPTIEVDLAHPFADGWNKIPGVAVQGAHLTIRTDEYFFRYENPSWTLCDSSAVARARRSAAIIAAVSACSAANSGPVTAARSTA
jgi:hypothetical protein